MALSQSVASELLEGFRAGEGVDLVGESVRLVMQELIETEATEHIGADRYERTSSHLTDRNGSRPRLVATRPGDIELRIPKLRKGSFLPASHRCAPGELTGELISAHNSVSPASAARWPALGRRAGRRQPPAVRRRGTARSRHGLDDCGLGMPLEGLLDLRVKGLQPFIEGEDARR